MSFLSTILVCSRVACFPAAAALFNSHAYHVWLELCIILSKLALKLKFAVQDVVMPSGGDGLDLLECLQADKRWRNIPVVSALFQPLHLCCPLLCNMHRSVGIGWQVHRRNRSSCREGAIFNKAEGRTCWQCNSTTQLAHSSRDTVAVAASKRYCFDSVLSPTHCIQIHDPIMDTRTVFVMFSVSNAGLVHACSDVSQ